MIIIHFFYGLLPLHFYKEDLPAAELLSDRFQGHSFWNWLIDKNAYIITKDRPLLFCQFSRAQSHDTYLMRKVNEVLWVVRKHIHIVHCKKHLGLTKGFKKPTSSGIYFYV